MLDSFPAAPGTLLLAMTEDGYRTEPIVGWALCKSGRAEPITPAATQPIQHGVAYLIPLPDGEGAQVFDPVYGKTAPTVDTWLEFVRAQDATVQEAAESGEIPYHALAVAFGDKTFMKASYWIFRDGTYEFVFEVEGMNPLPADSRVTKSNRKDFMALKKHVPVATVDDLMRGEPDEAPEVEIDADAESLI